MSDKFMDRKVVHSNFRLSVYQIEVLVFSQLSHEKVGRSSPNKPEPSSPLIILNLSSSLNFCSLFSVVK
jgi:hypothetical protein